MIISKHHLPALLFSLLLVFGTGCGGSTTAPNGSISTPTYTTETPISTDNSSNDSSSMQAVTTTTNQPNTTTSATSKNVDITAEDASKTVQLPDGSKIILNRGSRASYSENEGMEEKNVTLKGEAYFEVKAAKNKKFNVYAGNTKTTVVGTSFNIRAYEQEEDVILDVVEGVVNFIEIDNDKKKAEVITKERAIYKKPKRSIQKEISKNDDYKWWLGVNPNTTNTTQGNTIKTPPVEEQRTWKTATYKCNTKLETAMLQGQKETKTFVLPFATGYSINFTELAGNVGITLTSIDEQPLEKGDKIAFITAAKTQRSFAFTYEMQTRRVSGQTRYVNACKLTMAELTWLANNTIKQIQIVRTVEGKNYMRRINEDMQLLFSETARCFLEAIE